jgi:hypothetical protein
MVMIVRAKNEWPDNKNKEVTSYGQKINQDDRAIAEIANNLKGMGSRFKF